GAHVALEWHGGRRPIHRACVRAGAVSRGDRASRASRTGRRYEAAVLFGANGSPAARRRPRARAVARLGILSRGCRGEDFRHFLNTQKASSRFRCKLVRAVARSVNRDFARDYRDTDRDYPTTGRPRAAPPITVARLGRSTFGEVRKEACAMEVPSHCAHIVTKRLKAGS